MPIYPPHCTQSPARERKSISPILAHPVSPSDRALEGSPNDLAYCRERLRPWGSRASMIVHLAPANQKESLLAVFALESEWETLSRPARNPEGLSHRFAWWTEELRRLADGSPTHPVTRLLAARALQETLTHARLEKSLEGFLKARSLSATPGLVHESLLRRVGESRGLFLEASLLGKGPELPQAVFAALALADWLATWGFHSGGPEEGALLDRARSALASANAGLAPFRRDPSSWPLRVTFALARLQLDGVERSLRNPASHRPRARPGIPATLWTAWKAAL